MGRWVVRWRPILSERGRHEFLPPFDLGGNKIQGVADGVSESDVINVRQLHSVRAAGVEKSWPTKVQLVSGSAQIVFSDFGYEIESDDYFVAATLAGTPQEALAGKGLSITNRTRLGFTIECEDASASDYINLLISAKVWPLAS